MGMILPTKTNLIKVEQTIALSKQGHELLEKKKFILMREREKYIDRKKKIELNFEQSYNEGFQLLRNCNVDIGVSKVIEIGEKIRAECGLDIKYKTIMGVEIPSIVYNKSHNNEFLYGLLDTTISLDRAIQAFQNLKSIMIELAEIEITIARLDEAIEKVQTRANFLENIIIPNNEKMKRKISDILEERDREEFTRLKMIKRLSK